MAAVAGSVAMGGIVVPRNCTAALRVSSCSALAPAKLGARRFGGAARLDVGARASFAGVVKSGESGSVSESLRDQAEASFSLPKNLGGPEFFVLDLAEKLDNSVPAERQTESLGSSALAELRDKSAEKALNMRWPINKDEAYRFTDVRFLKNLNIVPTAVESASMPDLASGK